MKKHFVWMAGAAIIFASCQVIKVAPGQPVPFKEIRNKKVMLTKRPQPGDSIVITVIKTKN